MRLIKQLFNFYINSSIHVALSVFSLTWITLIEYHLLYDKNVLYFVFYATITGYNFVKYFGVAKFHHRSLATWLKAIQIFSFFCFVLMSYYAFQLEKNTLICIAVFGVVTFLYAIPFLPKHLFLDKQHNLRSIGGLKIYLIALVWSGVTVILPLVNQEYSISSDVIITAVQRYLFIIILMFPFEIRDLRYDSLKLSTIPQKIGVKETKTIGVLMLMLFFFLEFFKNEIAFLSTFVLLIITVITGLFLMFSKVEQTSYYSAFWVESIPVLWLILLLLST
ncbi:membrane protein [Wocania ichthyoenteri]|uniref:membrane protein n=1 Tax=Wocania ichthyoenteri TaxID=1230531 RepID=UPI00053E0233|nr:membrane protein [Wocania ichthyoenteri]